MRPIGLPQRSLRSWDHNLETIQQSISNLRNFFSVHEDGAAPNLDRLLNIFDDPVFTAQELADVMKGSGDTIGKLIEELASLRASTIQIRNASHHFVGIHRLPLELLQKIFEYGQDLHTLRPEDSLYEPFSNNVSYEFRSSISLVCHLWRDVCVSTSSLWATIVFGIRTPFEYTQLWIDRALRFGSQLDIFLSDHSEASRFWNRITALVISHYHQFRSLTWVGSQYTLRRLIAKIDAPTLARNVVQFHCNYGDWEEDGEESDEDGEGSDEEPQSDPLPKADIMRPLWDNLQSMRSLAFLGARLPLSLTTRDSVFSRLLDIHLSFPRGPRFQNREILESVLNNCSRLRSLSLEWFHCDPHPAGIEGTSATLADLSLLSFYESSVDQILPGLSAPNLHTLCLDKSTRACIPSLVVFLEQSCLSVRTVRLFEWSKVTETTIPNEANSLHTILKRLPSLEVLRLDGNLDDHIWNVLGKKRAGANWLCRNLREIHLHKATKFNPMTFSSMIRLRDNSRTMEGGLLRRLEVVSVDPLLAHRRKWGSAPGYEQAIRVVRENVKQVIWARD
jgi:hypothetical protein